MKRKTNPAAASAADGHLAAIVRDRYFNYVTASEKVRQAVGGALRIKRKEAGFETQRDLARAAGVNVETISRLENGANVEIATLSKVIDALSFRGVESDAHFERELDRYGAALETEEEVNSEYCGGPVPVIAEGELPPVIGVQPPRPNRWMPRPRTMSFDKTAYGVSVSTNVLPPVLRKGHVVVLTRGAMIRTGDIVYAQFKTDAPGIRLAYPQSGGYVLSTSTAPPTFVAADGLVELHRCVYIWMP